jgi:large subunit ribosomal protein L30
VPKLKITWQKSANGYPRDQRETLRALGLRRRGQTIVKEDSPSIRGMVDKVRHLVQAEPVEE